MNVPQYENFQPDNSGADYADLPNDWTPEQRLATVLNAPDLTATLKTLSELLDALPVIDWSQHGQEDKDGNHKPSERDYILRTIDNIIATAKKENMPFVNYAGAIYSFTGTHYKNIKELELQTFLINAAERCGVPPDTAIYQLFAERITKQFYINTAKESVNVSEPIETFINLQNGTLFFPKGKVEFKPHCPDFFIRYCLPFDFNSAVKAERWQCFLERVLPNKDEQNYLAEITAAAFSPLKLEKALLLYGGGHNGKSVFLDVISEVFGKDNIANKPLEQLTRTDSQGDYTRAMLDGKLVNIGTDISPKIADTAMFKTLVSGEPVAARLLYKDPFDMRCYAKLLFSMNELPYDCEKSNAFYRRLAIVNFSETITEQEKDINLAEKIICNELAGVLNWLIAGLQRLMQRGKLPVCITVENAVKEFRIDSDPVISFMQEREEFESIELKMLYSEFCDYLDENGLRRLSNKTFGKRLRNIGYKVEAEGRNHTRYVFPAKNFFTKNEANEAQRAQTPQNTELNIAPHLRPIAPETETDSLSGAVETLKNTEIAPNAPDAPHFSEKSFAAQTCCYCFDYAQTDSGGSCKRYDRKQDGMSGVCNHFREIEF